MKIDSELLNKKLQEKERLLNEASYLEGLLSSNRTPESIVKEAKQLLGISEEQKVKDHIDTFKNVNLLASSLLTLSGSIDKLVSSQSISGKELNNLYEVRISLVEKLSKVLGVDSKDLLKD